MAAKHEPAGDGKQVHQKGAKNHPKKPLGCISTKSCSHESQKRRFEADLFFFKNQCFFNHFRKNINKTSGFYYFYDALAETLRVTRGSSTLLLEPIE